ncbi:MAG: dephospho-CoA kinase [Gammaproteobacteria bacterium]|nr:dephospho-CoA kinase [Gammaproteobacteria bacterium]MBT3859968.1 dephospho-CoA kinase [Gammaproteobacteria bacterium]MBT3986430.1 dephospho-CoA kinase [Gammaproteobacteria bacterium]MBT4254820.1 dephospho-CoA kinase [Gammaproteobacteria bacterium]MBT4582990.1 dephospho-CoA kinase [Gammaproteobacteria bacterium]
MFVVGLTGGIGSGKSTVDSCFQNLGVNIVDADELSREVVSSGAPALNKIAEHFGSDILTSNGTLDREKLRGIVFSDADARSWLENLLHPLIAQLIQERIAATESDYCILTSPLLLETEQYKLADRVLVIDVSEQTQLSRTLQRDGSSEETIKSIIASQMKREKRLQKADDVLDNEGNLDSIESRVKSLHTNYLEYSKKCL